jgi:H+-translocating NAD(P) transhydrogenase subunit beta
MSTLINLAYLLAASLFILGIKRLSSPATARRGNQMAAIGMLIAVVATLLQGRILSPAMIVGGLALGAAVGTLLALRVRMTAMPELVAAFNGLGGGASVLVASAEIARYTALEADTPAEYLLHGLQPPGAVLLVTVLLSVLIGSVTFSGSFIAFGKLGEWLPGNPVSFPGMRVLSIALVLGVVAAGVHPLLGGAPMGGIDVSVAAQSVAIVVGLALLLGVLLVIPIGGADMPVVVALLNSYSGLAAAATGFVLQNYALIVSGALVGASGLILTRIMCDAMNRSLVNVLLGGFGGDGGGAAAGAVAAGGSHRETSAEDAAVLMAYAQKAVIVPGYGLAVAQAQHQARELANVLEGRGVQVRYAIHPVAGRMPGHMSVLLSEADVDYGNLITDVDEANDFLTTADVVLVVGANDIVNPDALELKGSPLYGMPIIETHRAKQVVVLKRSMRPGYAGVENSLFYRPNTAMLFGDAKSSLQALIGEVKQV